MRKSKIGQTTRVGTQGKTHHEISVDGKRLAVINEILEEVVEGLEEDFDGDYFQYFQVIDCEANRWHLADSLHEAKCRAAHIALGTGLGQVPVPRRPPFAHGEDLERWEIEIWGNEL